MLYGGIGIYLYFVYRTLKPRYSKQVSQTLFVHYIEQFTISNVNCLVNPQNGSWVLFTISQNSLYQGSLYRGLSVLLKAKADG